MRVLLSMTMAVGWGFVGVRLLEFVGVHLVGVGWCDLNISRFWKIDSLLELVGI